MAEKIGRFEQVSGLDLQIDEILNGISLGSGEGQAGNLDAYIIDMTEPTPFQIRKDIVIEHGLGRVPENFIVFNLSKEAIFYKGDNSFTDRYIYLKCNERGVTAKILVW